VVANSTSSGSNTPSTSGAAGSSGTTGAAPTSAPASAAAPAPTGPSLPNTGFDALGAALVGLVLLASGVQIRRLTRSKS
jgi:LPXTG-motif cell wall-anchored protein